jgi:hypothetical protein
MYEYGTLRPISVILRRGWKKKENNGGDETNWGTLYTYMEMSQQNHAIQLLHANKIVNKKSSYHCKFE